MAVAVAVAVPVSEGGAVAVPVAVAGLTKRFFNHIQKDFLINVWGSYPTPLLAFKEKSQSNHGFIRGVWVWFGTDKESIRSRRTTLIMPPPPTFY